MRVNPYSMGITVCLGPPEPPSHTLHARTPSRTAPHPTAPHHLAPLVMLHLSLPAPQPPLVAPEVSLTQHSMPEPVGPPCTALGLHARE